MMMFSYIVINVNILFLTDYYSRPAEAKVVKIVPPVSSTEVCGLWKIWSLVYHVALS